MEEKMYAIVDENNIVTNIMVANEEFAKSLNAIRLFDNHKCVTGKIFDDSNRYEIGLLNSYKERTIEISKLDLESYLNSNPLLYTDGKYYSVTKEKQNLLNNAIAVYNMRIMTGQTDAILEWNAKGEECAIWSLENLTNLALSIADYVKPLIAKQQNIEVQINNCKSIEELHNIIIDYDTLI